VKCRNLRSNSVTGRRKPHRSVKLRKGEAEAASTTFVPLPRVYNAPARDRTQPSPHPSLTAMGKPKLLDGVHAVARVRRLPSGTGNVSSGRMLRLMEAVRPRVKGSGFSCREDDGPRRRRGQRSAGRPAGGVTVARLGGAKRRVPPTGGTLHRWRFRTGLSGATAQEIDSADAKQPCQRKSRRSCPPARESVPCRTDLVSPDG
jgi:hypothetical protein